MANLSDQSFPPTNLGHVDEEMVPPGRRCRREKRHLKHCIKEKCSGFLIRKALRKVGVYSEYHVMPRMIVRNAYQQESEFDRGRLIACREYGISFDNIARVVLVQVQLLSCEYEISGLLRVILNGMHDLP
ncbi:hypothetical protein TNCV_4106141 [Trichonephila clavipes]|nr:hypothetical protein TNCV_4106141 [Trichonephila clavipes]